MPRFRIRMINSEFESCEEAEFASLEAARRSAVATATKVGGDAVTDGKDSAAVELRIYDGEELALRQVVTVSVSELIIH